MCGIPNIRIGLPDNPNVQGTPLYAAYLSDQLKQFLRVMQGCLFPQLEEQLGPLTGKQRQLIALLELLQIEAMVGCWRRRGPPSSA